MDKPAYRSRPGTTLDGRQQTTLGRSGITTTARAALVREAATSGTRGDTGAITTAPWLGSYNSVHSAARLDHGAVPERQSGHEVAAVDDRLSTKAEGQGGKSVTSPAQPPPTSWPLGWSRPSQEPSRW